MQCKDCGLLMLRDQMTGVARSADERARSTAHYVSTANTTAYTAKFLCRVSSPAFPCDPLVDSAQKSLASISQNIYCTRFMQWQPALTAEEHERMTVLEEVEQKNATARAEDRRQMEQWRAAELSEIERRHQEQLAWRRSVEEYARQQQADTAKETAQHRAEDRQFARNTFYATLAVGIGSAIISIVAIYVGLLIAKS